MKGETMSNDPNADEPRYCSECKYFIELDWRYRWHGAPDMFACVKDDDIYKLVLVTDDMEACRDWRHW